MTYENLYAAYPAYRQGKGNIIELVTKDGIQEVDQCFATFKSHWAQAYGRVWQEVIKESEELLGQKHLHVVYLSETCSQIPMRVRKPICKDDGAYGFLCDDKIISLEKVEGGTLIHMKEGIQFFTTTHTDTIKKYRRMVRLLKDEHKLRDQKIKKVIIYE